MAELAERLAAAVGDRYVIARELGRGGMGVVFLAHDVKHDRKIALKVLRSEIAESVNGERFLREIRTVARLQHPNIVTLLDSGTADGLTWYAMPFVEGESLRSRLERESQLTIDNALRIAIEVADALSYAHEHGVVHRDIKPENILLTDGHAQVADFGVAQAIEPAADKLTATGVAVGTPLYMSPEQASGMGNIDQRSDIYSLGCVLYEMLAGAPPFTGMTPMAVMARKASESVPGLRVVRDTISVDVERAIMKALARVPADRFANAREFAAALAGDTQSLQARSSGAAASRRRWMLAGALGAVALIAGAYVLIASAGGGESRAGPAVATFTQLTSMSGVEWFPSLSVDGKWLVYAGTQSGNRDIYLQDVLGQQPIDLTSDSPDDDDQPAFSPDGGRIAFRSARDGGGLFVMARTGEGVRRVTRSGFRPTWSPDGTRIAYVSENVELNPGNSEGISELWIVNADGSAPRKLQTGDAIFPSWSPHGHRIAFAKRLGVPAQGDIYTVSPDGGAPVPLLTDRARDWSPAWSPDGRYLYFASDRGGSMNLWRLAVDEKSGKARGEPEPVTTPATFLAHPTVSGDGRHIAYTSAQTTINIQGIAFDPRAGTVVGEPSAVTTGSRQWSSPDPSPDGKWVAFYTLTQPEGDVYLSKPDGTGLRQLTSDTAIDRLPRWSPNGEWIAVFSNRAGVLHLWKVRRDGSELQRMTKDPAGYIAWSPDGSRVATVTGIGNNTLGDSPGIIDANRNADNQRTERLPRSTFGDFLVNSWSPDGQRLAGQISAVGSMGKGIGIYTFTTRTYEKLTDFGEWPVWLPDSRRILFVANRTEFYVLDTRTKQTRRIFSVARDVVGPPRLTRDGRAAYFSRRVTSGDVWMLTLR